MNKVKILCPNVDALRKKVRGVPVPAEGKAYFPRNFETTIFFGIKKINGNHVQL